MSDIINLSICLSDIPKDKIKQADNGKKYLNITAARRREADTYGNTHGVFVTQTKEEREAKVERTWLGNGKEFSFAPAAATAESVEAMPATKEIDDLPF